MARSRNIKPGFFSNDALAECSRDARLLFIGLWTIADREGRLADKPKRIKVEVFPYDNDVDCEPLLGQLALHGFIIRYVVDGVGYIEIPKFCKHQNPHIKEKASEIPVIPCSTIQAPEKPSASNPPNTSVSGLNPESCSLNPERGKRKDDDSYPLSLSNHSGSKDFCEAWQLWKLKQSSKTKRPMDPATEQCQLKDLMRFDTDEAIAIVQFSTSRTDCKNLITDGSHRAKPPPTNGKSHAVNFENLVALELSKRKR